MSVCVLPFISKAAGKGEGSSCPGRLRVKIILVLK